MQPPERPPYASKRVVVGCVTQREIELNDSLLVFVVVVFVALGDVDVVQRVDRFAEVWVVAGARKLSSGY